MIVDDDAPYPGLRAFEEADAHVFCGRDRDTRIVSTNVLTARLTVLYAPSGVGKSSLLRAGVTPRLRARPRTAAVVHAAWTDDPVRDLKQTIARELNRLALDLSPAEVDQLDLNGLARAGEKHADGPLLILLDQFEDNLLYRSGQAISDRFDAELARAVNDPACPVHVLIAVREDVLARMDRLGDRIPSIFDNYLRLEPLTLADAEEAIRAPLRTYSLTHSEAPATIEDDLVRLLLEQVGDHTRAVATPSGRRRPAGADAAHDPSAPANLALLQLVLRRLWTESRQTRPIVLRAHTLQRLGGSEKILDAHFSAVIAALTREQQDVAARVLRFLVTPSGKTNAYSAPELASYAEVPLTDVEPVLERLAEPNVRLLRPVLAGSAQHAVISYEMAFDILARAALTWRARYIALGTARWRRQIVAVGLIALLVAIVEVAVAPPNPVLLVSRGLAYVALSTMLLVRIYRWFLRYVSMTGFLSIRTFRSPRIGVVISALLSALWYLSTNLTAIDAAWPAHVTTLGFLAFSFTLLVSGTLGVILFSLMNVLGQITAARFQNFDLGLYAGFALACVLLGLAIGAAITGPSNSLFWQVRVSAATLCADHHC